MLCEGRLRHLHLIIGTALISPDAPHANDPPYAHLSRSPSDGYGVNGSYWDSDTMSSASSEHKREPPALTISSRPVASTYDPDDRPIRHSPTRSYRTVSPATTLRRESYWPDRTVTPTARSPYEPELVRAHWSDEPNRWYGSGGVPSWNEPPFGWDALQPSLSFKPPAPITNTYGTVGPIKDNHRAQGREGNLRSTSPSSVGRTTHVSRSISPASRRSEYPQYDRAFVDSTRLSPEDEHDSVASTPHDERHLSPGPSPGSSNTPSTPEIVNEGNKAPPRTSPVLTKPPVPVIPEAQANSLDPLALSNTPPPGVLPAEPIIVETATVEADHAADSAVPEVASPEADSPEADSLERATPDTPAILDASEPVVKRTRDHVPMHAPLARRSQKARAPVLAAAVPDAVEEPEDDASPAPVPEFRETLRIFAMMRLRRSHQTREERVNPVLSANDALTDEHRASSEKISGPDGAPALTHATRDVVEECMDTERIEARVAVNEAVRPSLQARFARRQADLNDKLTRLRTEYLDLNERWLAHCAKLDDVAKAGALEEAAANAGRTTRRSTATLGDAVRSDLEMEQIIASLGNEELTDATHLASRNAAIIPNMVSVEAEPHGGLEEYLCLYDDTNNLVEDPDAFYAPRTGLYDWTDEERRTFLEKYAATPKQFGTIAKFLPHKTAAQCVTYYYLHKHEIDFRKVVAKFAHGKRRRGGGRSGGGKNRRNALLSDIMERDAEFSREHTPAVVPAPGKRARIGPVPAGGEGNGGKRPGGARRVASGLVEGTPGSTPTPTPDPEPDARRKRRRVAAARAAAVIEQEADIDDTEIEDVQDDAKPKRSRRSRRVKTTVDSTIAVSQTSTPVIPHEELPASLEPRFDQADAASRKKFVPANAVWSEDDKAQLVLLLSRYGDDFKRIAASMPSKTTAQISTFYRTNMTQMNLEHAVANASRRSPTPEQLKEPLYREARTAYPGSGILTPDVYPSPASANHTPPMLEMSSPPLPNGHTMETRFRLNGMTAGRQRSLHDGMGSGSEPVNMPGPNSYHFHRPAAMMDHPMHAQYAAGSGPHLQSAPMSSLSAHPHPSLIGGPPLPHFIANPSPFASPQPPSLPPPSTLTTTFPSSFPYTNLSPSHFTHANAPPPNGAPYAHPHLPGMGGVEWYMRSSTAGQSDESKSSSNQPQRHMDFLRR
ncbi:hypothetical protein EUX98_g4435 [Antrodiella citrinella]|uniref:SANT domain-containing protein n=1 Tax=Antrodiella citrinella TaxID=2447956 RepID=A0A4S4MU39_9APHY|nr:hypothetical protein EUX98_g4435 [Antrodiella citrinella]